MVISDSNKFVFLHNPKVAGTSVRQALLTHYDTRNNFFWGVEKSSSLHRWIDKAHMAIDDMKVAFPGDYSLLDEYFVFAFVRNPFERYVSSFAEFVRHHRKDVDMSRCGPGQILDMIETFTVRNVSADKIRYDYRFRHFMPQYYVIYCGHKCKADYIGRMDSIGRDIQKLARLLGLEALPKVREFNVQAKKFGNLHHELPKRTRESIVKLYENDFLFFDFDPQA